MTLHITLNVQKKIAMKTMQGKLVVDCGKGLLTITVGKKTLTYLNILLKGNINPLAFKSLVSWEVIIIRTNFAEKQLSHYSLKRNDQHLTHKRNLYRLNCLTEVIKSFKIVIICMYCNYDNGHFKVFNVCFFIIYFTLQMVDGMFSRNINVFTKVYHHV